MLDAALPPSARRPPAPRRRGTALSPRRLRRIPRPVGPRTRSRHAPQRRHERAVHTAPWPLPSLSPHPGLRLGAHGATVGSALLASAAGFGHRRVADQLALPATTVRGWLRRARANHDEVWSTLTRRALELDPRASPAHPSGHPFGALLGAIGQAIGACSRRSTRAPGGTRRLDLTPPRLLRRGRTHPGVTNDEHETPESHAHPR